MSIAPDCRPAPRGSAAGHARPSAAIADAAAPRRRYQFIRRFGGFDLIRFGQPYDFALASGGHAETPPAEAAAARFRTRA